jgi:hypothetical protein
MIGSAGKAMDLDGILQDLKGDGSGEPCYERLPFDRPGAMVADRRDFSMNPRWTKDLHSF